MGCEKLELEGGGSFNSRTRQAECTRASALEKGANGSRIFSPWLKPSIIFLEF
jgi:hypothetical protein